MPMTTMKHVARIGWASLLVAWLFDFLFWQKAPGISFCIFVLVCLAAGLGLAWSEGLRPARTALALILPAGFFSVMSFLRLEPFSMAISILTTLALMALLANTFLGGRWAGYSLSDYGLGLLRLAGSMLVKPLGAIELLRTRRREAHASQPAPATAPSRPTAAIFRGIAITLPVVAVLAALLASADPIFNQGLSNLLNVFHIENLGETIFRGIYILTGGYLLAGVFLHVLAFSRDEHLVGLEKPWLKPFLGGTESGILLGSVNLLFAVFVAVQARYFFGGQANIQAAGFTYAEYARRGFGELVAVAVISLLLILGLSTIARRETRGQRRLFNGLVAGLVALVLVILVSAFQRLLLYEGAYGFTRLRTYTHAFIPWLGLLLGVTALLELVRRPRNFALAVLLVTIGFSASLNLLDVDAFVAQQNITRATQGQELDLGYLARLSDDAVPMLVSQFHNTGLPAGVRERVGAALACRVEMASDAPVITHWQSYNVSRARAQNLLGSIGIELKAFPTDRAGTGEPQVRVNGTQESCWSISSEN